MNETFYDSQHSKYRDDTIFGYVSSEYLTLSEEERKINNQHLHTVIQEIIQLMREDELFDLTFNNKIVYGGSYYKGTKYGTPEEFDLNFVIRLPIDYDDIKIDTNHKNFGFVKIKLNSKAALDPEWKTYSYKLDGLLTRDNYLDQKRFRSWMESVFKKALSHYESDNGYELCINDTFYNIKYKKSGPAFTMMISTDEEINIDVDIVPCLEFNYMKLKNGFKPMNKELKKPWMVVAKPLPKDIPESNVLWRPCFYHYEKEILEGAVKPVIRMVKKFRDTMGWDNLASYYIETLFYHELEKQRWSNNYLRSSKTWLFMHALSQLQKAMEKQELPYYWHPKFNLFSKIQEKQLTRYASELKKKIAFIDAKIESDSLVLADVVLDKYEAQTIRRKEKRVLKSLQRSYNSTRSRCNEFNSVLEQWINVLAILFLFYVMLQKNVENDVHNVAV